LSQKAHDRGFLSNEIPKTQWPLLHPSELGAALFEGALFPGDFMETLQPAAQFLSELRRVQSPSDSARTQAPLESLKPLTLCLVPLHQKLGTLGFHITFLVPDGLSAAWK
jgi:hypothetical protein